MAGIYSIGYANLEKNHFLEHLKNNQITALADVRSMPYSKMFSDYNRENLSEFLKENGISYVYLGEELGPRSKERSHYDSTGQVQFNLLSQTPLFLSGIERLQKGVRKGYNIAMMCAEKMPETCHRSLLVSEFLLTERSMSTQHIHQNGSLESHVAMRGRLVNALGLQADMFHSNDGLAQDAIEHYVKKHAFRQPPDKTMSR